MTRIDISIESGEFSKNPVLLGLLKAVSSKDGRLHLCGLLSDGGVHSHINHVEALLALAQQHGIKALVHAFLDGRDTPPASAVQYVARLKELTTKYGGELADMTGRFYAMDRDKHWERIKIAWDALIHGIGSFSADPVAELNKAYSQGETDEFLKPR
ncbi:MAG: 2,3-bisphosphoglycerate-independent phosphoglycerate mutase, partial [Mailhella sp.]|nr:2,3-bisphosphoglycerate-independent phosphoglycerate mutase [Mailhella sp.]